MRRPSAAATGTRATPFARGTNYAKGGIALVGEQGPELIFLPKGSAVKTAAETSGIMAGPAPNFAPARGGDGASVYNIVVNTGIGDPTAIAREVKRVLAIGSRNGVS